MAKYLHVYWTTRAVSRISLQIKRQEMLRNTPDLLCTHCGCVPVAAVAAAGVLSTYAAYKFLSRDKVSAAKYESLCNSEKSKFHGQSTSNLSSKQDKAIAAYLYKYGGKIAKNDNSKDEHIEDMARIIYITIFLSEKHSDYDPNKIVQIVAKLVYEEKQNNRIKSLNNINRI